jgi:hypothetical protein
MRFFGDMILSKKAVKNTSKKVAKKTTNNEIKKATNSLRYVIDIAHKNYKWLEQIVNEYTVEWAHSHNYKLLLKNWDKGFIDIVTANWGKHNNTGFRKYGQLRLELIAQFNPQSELCRKRYHLGGPNWKVIENTDELKSFAATTRIKKWGKLKSWDAKVMYFAVLAENNKCHYFSLYNVEKLKKNCDYFINKYGAILYLPENDEWALSYVPVNKDDKILESCRITNKQEFLKCFMEDKLLLP